MEERPDRGRIIIVNFEIAGTATPPEMNGTGRPCLVVQNNKLHRGRLVTVIPLSTTAPDPPGKQHHLMSHLSFREMPFSWEPGTPRWAKCDYVSTVALSRCKDPYSKPDHQPRKYVKVKVIKADMDAVDKCLRWALSLWDASD